MLTLMTMLVATLPHWVAEAAAQLHAVAAAAVLAGATWAAGATLVAVQGATLLAAWRWRWRDALLAGASRGDVGDSLTGCTGALLSAEVHGYQAPIRGPRLSVVLTWCDEADDVERSVEALLSQEAEGVELIVVDATCRAELRGVVEGLTERYPRLRHTFVPSSAQHDQRALLALTLGIRAARAPWVVPARAGFVPRGRRWAACVAARCAEAKGDVLLTAATFSAGGRVCWRRGALRRLRWQLMLARAAHCGAAIGVDVAGVALRREVAVRTMGRWTLLPGPTDRAQWLTLGTMGAACTEVVFEADCVVEEQRLRSRRQVSTLRRRKPAEAVKPARRWALREWAAAAACALHVAAGSAYAAERILMVTSSGGYVTTPQFLATDAAWLLFVAAGWALPWWALRQATRRLQLPRVSALRIVLSGLWRCTRRVRK